MTVFRYIRSSVLEQDVALLVVDLNNFVKINKKTILIALDAKKYI